MMVIECVDKTPITVLMGPWIISDREKVKGSELIWEKVDGEELVTDNEEEKVN